MPTSLDHRSAKVRSPGVAAEGHEMELAGLLVANQPAGHATILAHAETHISKRDVGHPRRRRVSDLGHPPHAFTA